MEKESGQEEELESGGGGKLLGGDVGGERYVLAHELAKWTGDRDAVRQELLNVFLAAHDGPAIALTSIVFDLARHPAVWGEAEGGGAGARGCAGDIRRVEEPDVSEIGG